jgi:hypothetical protein
MVASNVAAEKSQSHCGMVILAHIGHEASTVPAWIVQQWLNQLLENNTNKFGEFLFDSYLRNANSLIYTCHLIKERSGDFVSCCISLVVWVHKAKAFEVRLGQVMHPLFDTNVLRARPALFRYFSLFINSYHRNWISCLPNQGSIRKRIAKLASLLSNSHSLQRFLELR